MEVSYYVLANQFWSLAGEGGRDDVNTTFFQPFLNYTTQTATTYFLNAESSYDGQDDEATVPINFGVNQLLEVGDQAMQLGGRVRILFRQA